MEKNTLLNHEVVMASSDKTTNNFITKMKKESRLVKIASKILTSSVAEARALGHPLWMSSFFLLSPYCHLAAVPR